MEACGGRLSLDQPFAVFYTHLGDAAGPWVAFSPAWLKDLGSKLIRES